MGSPAGGQELISIPNTDLAEAPQETLNDEVVSAIVYNGPTDDVSYVVLYYVPASGSWYATLAVNNSGLSLSQLQALVKTSNFLSAIKTMYSYETASPPSGGGGGGGRAPITETFQIPQEGCTTIIGWDNSDPSVIYSETSCQYIETP